MHVSHYSYSFLALLLCALLGGCAGGGKAQPATQMSSGGSLITILASSYKFSPDRVSIEKPGPVALEIKNRSGSEHNFTLKDPSGKTVKSVDIRPGASIISNIDLIEPGTYEYFCNRSFHARMGMKGKIVVGNAK